MSVCWPSLRAPLTRIAYTIIAMVLLYVLSIGPVIYFSVWLTNGMRSSAPIHDNIMLHDWAGNSSFEINGGRARERRNPYPILVNAYRPLWWMADHTSLSRPLARYCDWWLGLREATIPMEYAQAARDADDGLGRMVVAEAGAVTRRRIR
jgi:hypothetical protein